jgi:prevent-host-death family protein
MARSKSVTYRQREASERLLVEEVRSVPGVGQTISVRAAKAHLSALLDLVASGTDITITSDGSPKAQLVSLGGDRGRRLFAGAKGHLSRMPAWKPGPTAEELVRADRDGRG